MPLLDRAAIFASTGSYPSSREPISLIWLSKLSAQTIYHR